MAGGLAKSFVLAAELLKRIGEIDVSSRQVNNLMVLVGTELASVRDQQTEAYLAQPLPRQPTQVASSPQLACVEVDGGRRQTRTVEQGPGVHEAHWRETKTAGFFRMKTTSHPADLHPELPHCFADSQQMQGLLPGLAESSGSTDPPPKSNSKWQPEVLFRTCLASLESSGQFGPMMAAKADTRGFYAARAACVLGRWFGLQLVDPTKTLSDV